MGGLVFVLLSLVCSQNKATITVDYSQVPDVREWAEKARDLCEKWYPTISEILAGKDFTPPRAVRIVFRGELFKEWTGSDLDALWKEFISSQG